MKKTLFVFALILVLFLVLGCTNGNRSTGGDGGTQVPPDSGGKNLPVGGRGSSQFLSGTITYPDGSLASGVKVSSNHLEKTVTDAAGKYKLTNIGGGDPAPTNIMVTFEKEGYTTVTKVFDTGSIRSDKPFDLVLEPAQPRTEAQRICGKIYREDNYAGYKVDLCDASKGPGFEEMLSSLTLVKELNSMVSPFDSNFVSITEPKLGAGGSAIFGFSSIEQINDCSACGGYPAVKNQAAPEPKPDKPAQNAVAEFVDCGTVKVSGDREKIKPETSCFAERAEKCLKSKITTEASALGGKVSVEFEITGGTASACETRQKVLSAGLLEKDAAGKEMSCTISAVDYMESYMAPLNYLYKCEGGLKDSLSKIWGVAVFDGALFMKGGLVDLGANGTGQHLFNDKSNLYSIAIDLQTSPDQGSTIESLRNSYEESYQKQRSPQAACMAVDAAKWSVGGSAIVCTMPSGKNTVKAFHLQKNSRLIRIVGLWKNDDNAAKSEKAVDSHVQKGFFWQ